MRLFPTHGIASLAISTAGVVFAIAAFSFDEVLGDGPLLRMIHATGALVLLPLTIVTGCVLAAYGLWKRERYRLVTLFAFVLNLIPILYIMVIMLL